MTTISKRFTIAGALALLVVIVALALAQAGWWGYRAESFVAMRTYTNVFFARSFEADLIRKAPSILRLRVTPSFSGIPGGSAPVLTNGVKICIFASGPTAEYAQRAANKAAEQVRQIVLTNYGVEGFVAQVATNARSYSYFHDGFKPGVARLFKH